MKDLFICSGWKPGSRTFINKFSLNQTPVKTELFPVLKRNVNLRKKFYENYKYSSHNYKQVTLGHGSGFFFLCKNCI